MYPTSVEEDGYNHSLMRNLRAYLTLTTLLTILADNRDTRIREDSILFQQKGLTLTKLHTPLLEDFYFLYTENTFGHATCVSLHFFT